MNPTLILAQALAESPRADDDSSIALFISITFGVVAFLGYLIITGMRRNPSLTISILLGVVGGAFAGIVVSYWLQPGMLRMSVSLGEYFTSLPELLAFDNPKTKGLQTTLYGSTIVLALIGGIGGWWYQIKNK